MTTAINSLGFAKAPKDTRVVVAMSGGVDSSVVAGLLAEQGYDVVGITLQLYDHGVAIQKKGACCAGQDIYDARMVAEKLNIPYYVLDYEGKFLEAVMEDFADTYLAGETPVPCIRCNQTVKFRDLLQTARELGADCLATGHYVRRVGGLSGARLERPADLARDQSYFLFTTTQAQLDFLRFPLSDMPKEMVRQHAERLGLEIAAKPDSQDICFVPTGSYGKIVERLRPTSIIPGDIVHLDGRVLGQHHGIINYTVGQRKGIGIGGRADDSEPLYVIRLDAATHQVVVGPKAALARDQIWLKEVNWLGGAIPTDGMAVEVKTRSAQPLQPARLYPGADGLPAWLVLDKPYFGIAPGQACVVYLGNQCLGGGFIAHSALSNADSRWQISQPPSEIMAVKIPA